jgi:hypothetical protein
MSAVYCEKPNFGCKHIFQTTQQSISDDLGKTKARIWFAHKMHYLLLFFSCDFFYFYP